MIILGALRVKNESRWIERVIKSLRPLCSYIVVMDDHSTDDTVSIAESAGALVLPSPFSGFDETRDKNWLLDWILRGEVIPVPEWVVMIDGDELLEPEAIPLIVRAIEDQPYVDAFSFEVVYLWNDEHTRRTDLRTFCRTRASMFKLGGIHPRRFRCAPGYEHHGLHCGNVPYGYGAVPITGARLLHLGYMLKEDRLRKWEWYNEIDPDNCYEDRYAHMVIGDLDDLPASAVTKWGGPLKLEAL